MSSAISVSVPERTARTRFPRRAERSAGRGIVGQPGPPVGLRALGSSPPHGYSPVGSVLQPGQPRVRDMGTQSEGRWWEQPPESKGDDARITKALKSQDFFRVI